MFQPLKVFLRRTQKHVSYNMRLLVLFPTLDRNLESPRSDDAALGALFSDVTVVVTGVDNDGVTMVAPGMALISLLADITGPAFINMEI